MALSSRMTDYRWIWKDPERSSCVVRCYRRICLERLRKTTKKNLSGWKVSWLIFEVSTPWISVESGTTIVMHSVCLVRKLQYAQNCMNHLTEI
jgi:hypothetical protein